jgi:hypothetical protein
MDALKAIACSIHDSVMVLAPGGWTSVELEVVDTPHGLRVASLQTKGLGAREPKPLPRLGIAREHEAVRLSEALDELAVMLAEQGKATWPGGKATLQRGSGSSDLKLLGEGERAVWFSRLDAPELELLLFTDALFDALLGSEPGFELLQSQLEVTPQSALLELGRYDREEFVWVWNHAEPRVRSACAVESQPPGLSALWRDAFACEEGFAWALCSHLCVALGARGLARVEEQGAVKLCAVTALKERP